MKYKIFKLNKKFINLSTLINSKYDQYSSLNNIEAFYQSVSYLNYWWQYWNYIWRCYTLMYIKGGYNINNVKIIGCMPRKNEAESMFYALYLIGKKSNPNGVIKGSYEEKSWGSYSVINKLSTTLFASTNISHVLSLYKNTLEHFQDIRNSSIHLNKDTIIEVKIKLLPHYMIKNFKYPTEILFSRDLKNNIVYKQFINELLSMLKYLE